MLDHPGGDWQPRIGYILSSTFLGTNIILSQDTVEGWDFPNVPETVCSEKEGAGGIKSTKYIYITEKTGIYKPGYINQIPQGGPKISKIMEASKNSNIVASQAHHGTWGQSFQWKPTEFREISFVPIGLLLGSMFILDIFHIFSHSFPSSPPQKRTWTPKKWKWMKER